jgi:hypothetical protein
MFRRKDALSSRYLEAQLTSETLCGDKNKKTRKKFQMC